MFVVFSGLLSPSKIRNSVLYARCGPTVAHYVVQNAKQKSKSDFSMRIGVSRTSTL
jgi:hypothetical protein